jgi:hypothetical protein
MYWRLPKLDVGAHCLVSRSAIRVDDRSRG